MALETEVDKFNGLLDFAWENAVDHPEISFAVTDKIISLYFHAKRTNDARMTAFYRIAYIEALEIRTILNLMMLEIPE